MCSSRNIREAWEGQKGKKEEETREGGPVLPSPVLNKLLLSVPALKPRPLPLCPGCDWCMFGWQLEDSGEVGLEGTEAI